MLLALGISWILEIGCEFQFVGAHIISGNVFEPVALDELLPHWRQEQVCLFLSCETLCIGK